jgi:hypothetical protein
MATHLCKGALALGLFGLALAGFSGEPGSGPVKVKIRDENPVAVEPILPIDPTQHAQVSSGGAMNVTLRVDNKTMHLGTIQTNLKIDGRILQPGNPPGRMLSQNQPLPQKPGARKRIGFQSVYEINKMQITQTAEVVPSRAPKGGGKRRLDAMLVQYLVDNKDTQAHQVGVRVWMDVYIVNNDGALFAAPNKPGKILDGIEIKDKDVPDYLQALERPDLKNPGFVAHYTYKLGKNFEMPNRVILTNLGGAFGNGWDMQIMQAMGDSAMGFYWDPRELAPGRKRNLAYGYGEGVVPPIEGDGQFTVELGGSFEPGKLFTVTARIHDPAPGQALTLELPSGMERIEGKEIQPVPLPGENGHTLVLWKARVLRTGEFPLRISSNTGVTQTKMIDVSR